MTETKTPTSTWIALAAIAAIAFAVRAFGIDARSLWYDEILSLTYGKMPFLEIPVVLQDRSTNPPLYFELIRGWITLWGGQDSSLRWFSVVMGTASIPLVFWIGSLLNGRRMGLIAALLFALNPFQVRYAQEGRVFALLAFVALAGFGALLAYVRQPTDGDARRSRGYLWIGALSSVALFTLHFYGILTVIATNLCAFLLLKGNKLRTWILFQGVLALVAGLLYVPMLRFQLAHPGEFSWLPPLSFRSLTSAWFDAHGGFDFAWLYFVLALEVPMIGYITTRTRSGLRTYFVFALWCLAPFLIATAVSLLTRPCLHPRYLIASMVGIIVLAAWGVESLLRWRFRWGIVALSIAVILSGLKLLEPENSDVDWRGAVARMARHGLKAGDTIVTMHPSRGMGADFETLPLRYHLETLTPGTFYRFVEIPPLDTRFKSKPIGSTLRPEITRAWAIGKTMDCGTPAADWRATSIDLDESGFLGTRLCKLERKKTEAKRGGDRKGSAL